MPRRTLASVARSFLLLTAAFLLLVVPAIPAKGAFPPSAEGAHVAVATAQREATEAAFAILRGGGNAVDAAVGAALTLGVPTVLAGTADRIAPLDTSSLRARRASYTNAEPRDLRGILLSGSLALFLVDAIIVALLGGGLAALLRRRAAPAALAIALILAAMSAAPMPSRADSSDDLNCTVTLCRLTRQPPPVNSKAANPVGRAQRRPRARAIQRWVCLKSK